MPNYTVLFQVTRIESYTVEAATPEEARNVAHDRLKLDGPIHALLHRQTTDVSTANNEIYYRYNEYFETCERGNKIPLAFNAWRLREGV